MGEGERRKFNKFLKRQGYNGVTPRGEELVSMVRKFYAERQAKGKG